MTSIYIPDKHRIATVALSDIDQAFPAQLRAREVDQAIDDYADAMQRGEEFPMPVVVTADAGYVVVDGHHRIKAALKIGRTTITAKVFDTPVGVVAVEFAKVLGVRFNNQNGVRKTAKDRHSERLITIPLLRRIGMSNRQMAAELRCDEKTIRNLLAELPPDSGERDRALEAAVLHDFLDSPDKDAEPELAPMALDGEGQKPELPTIPKNLPRELQRRIYRNKEGLGMGEADALNIFMAAAALLQRMKPSDACMVTNALYALSAQS